MYPVVNGNPHAPKKNNFWARICIWGDDDLGMEKDFDFNGLTAEQKESKIKEMVVEINGFPNPLNQEWLRAHGYKYA